LDAILGRCAALQDIRLLRRTNKPVSCIPPKADIGPVSALLVENRFPDPMELPGAKSCRIFRRQKGEFTGWYGNASFSAHGSSDGFPHRRRPA
ncbi:hypothetical protein GGI1_11078, partial [Acidithiobacillus sp. GGI-221]